MYTFKYSIYRNSWSNGGYRMNYVHFTFNNFFDYSIIVEQLRIKRKWLFNPDKLIFTFPYTFTSEYVTKYITDLCKPLNIQFTITIEVTEDTE